MKMPNRMDAGMLAPCGVLCLVCSAYLNKKKPCPGCRAPADMHKRKSCVQCAKKNCALGKGLQWCFACGSFPCARIKSLNKRYVQNYGVDLVQNGLAAQTDMTVFLLAQRAQFTCLQCGGIVDQHHRRCSECGAESD